MVERARWEAGRVSRDMRENTKNAERKHEEDADNAWWQDAVQKVYDGNGFASDGKVRAEYANALRKSGWKQEDVAYLERLYAKQPFARISNLEQRFGRPQAEVSRADRVAENELLRQEQERRDAALKADQAYNQAFTAALNAGYSRVEAAFKGSEARRNAVRG